MEIQEVLHKCECCEEECPDCEPQVIDESCSIYLCNKCREDMEECADCGEYFGGEEDEETFVVEQ